MSAKKNEGRINIEELPRTEHELTTEEAKDVKGGIGLLVPAINPVREAAGRSQSVIGAEGTQTLQNG